MKEVQAVFFFLDLFSLFLFQLFLTNNVLVITLFKHVFDGLLTIDLESGEKLN